MGSITASPDRIAQVVSGSGVLQGAGDSAVEPVDSNLQVVDQAATGISAATIVYENRQQYSSLSEGVASAGHPPMPVVDRMDESRPAYEPIDPAPSATAYEGETSGGHDAYILEGAEESNGYEEGEEHAIQRQQSERGGGRELPPHAASERARGDGTTSMLAEVREGGTGGSAIRGEWIGVDGYADVELQAATSGAMEYLESHAGGKRKCYPEGGSEGNGLESKRTEGGFNRVPSDLAMMMGMSDGENEELVEKQCRGSLQDPCDSSLAGIEPGVAAAATAADETAQLPFPGGERDGHTDADIIEWENRIREEEVRNVPLVGDLESLDSLREEYCHGSRIFLAKIDFLKNTYGSIRRTRGDGNCFFRSFIFAYLENILKTMDLAERDAAIARFRELRTRLTAAGYEELVLETPMDLLLGLIESIGRATDPLTLEILENNLRADEISNYIVFLLRLITSAEIKHRAEFFAPFIMGLTDMDVDSFCARCVDPMGEESDHVQMVALTDVLNVPVRVVYLDRSTVSCDDGGYGGSNEKDIDEDDVATRDERGGDAVGQAGASYASAVDGTASAAGTVGSVIGDSLVMEGRNGGGMAVRVDVHDFLPEGIKAGEKPWVCLLYRPGHYDILYEKAQ